MTLIDYIKESKRILIVGHMRPDGDCLGAGLSLLFVCDKYGKEAYFVSDSDLPSHYTFMPGFDRVNKISESDYDLLIAVDSGDVARLGKYRKYLSKVRNSINIDHHQTNDNYCKVNYVDFKAGSTCQILYNLLSGCGEMTKEIAECLFVGLSTDTGHFMHNTTTAEVFDIAASLTRYGVEPGDMAEKLYKSRTLNKTRLIVRAIESLRFFEDGSVAIISIFEKDLEECGCKLSDTEGLIDYAMNISSVKIAVCMTEQNTNSFKVSFRSKGINVSDIAGEFGGGGHIRAAGCMISGFYEDVISRIVKAITDRS